MPEGPEIRLAADKIQAVLKDQTVEKIEFGLAPLKKHRKSLQGNAVTELETRGAFMCALIARGSGFCKLTHFHLYGVGGLGFKHGHFKTIPFNAIANLG